MVIIERGIFKDWRGERERELVGLVLVRIGV